MTTLIVSLQRALSAFQQMDAWRAAGILFVSGAFFVTILSLSFTAISSFGNTRGEQTASLTTELEMSRTESKSLAAKLTNLESVHTGATREWQTKEKELK